MRQWVALYHNPKAASLSSGTATKERPVRCALRVDTLLNDRDGVRRDVLLTTYGTRRKGDSAEPFRLQGYKSTGHVEVLSALDGRIGSAYT